MRRARRPQRSQSISLPAPVRGLVEDIPTKELPLDAAEWLENFIPTTRGVRVRGGTILLSDVGAPVKSMFSFEAGTAGDLFASTASEIRKVNSPASVQVSGLTSGDWSAQQVGTTGGDFLVVVNGADPAYVFNGATWAPLSDEAVNALDYDALSADFVVGETVTGGTSGASAEILGLVRASATAGTLYLGAVTNGPFQDDEAITSASGSADVDGTIGVANSVTITNVATADLSDVWLYRSRLFFIEKESLKAWYLPSGAIGGAAASISLAGVFRKGGTLLLGGTWSLDGGDGMDDKCVFVTSKGEVAIYSGGDPSDATTWQLEGRYDMAPPLGKRATMQAGGDFLIATDEGIVPVSSAIRKDPAALSLSAVTNNIRNTWRDEVSMDPGNVELVRWTEGNLLFAIFAGSSRMLTCNLQTGAWAQQTGWKGDCGAVFKGSVYIGREDGKVVAVDEGGQDEGEPFTARMGYPFMEMGAPAAYKILSMARGAFLADNEFTPKFSAAIDYNMDFPSAPSVAAVSSTSMVWGASNWGEATWGGAIGEPRKGRVEPWVSISGAGQAIAPQLQITSGSPVKISVELVGMDILWEAGGVAS